MSIANMVLPEPTPTPPPVVVAYPLATGPQPGMVSGVTGFPSGLDPGQSTYSSKAGDELSPLGSNLWNVDGSQTDSGGHGSVAYFHSPVLTGGITATKQISQIDLNFRGGRTNASPTKNTNAHYSVWIFKGGVYPASEWANPAAWDQVGSPQDWTNKQWAGLAAQTVSLKQNFDRYVSTAADPGGDAAQRFGGVAGGPVRPAGTLTWAVCSIADESGSALKFDYARALVYPFGPPAPRPAPEFLEGLMHDGNNLHLWARQDGDQCTSTLTNYFQGTTLFTLHVDPVTSTVQNRLTWKVKLNHKYPELEVRLRGYAGRKADPAEGDPSFTKTLYTTAHPDDGSVHSDTWDYGADGVFGANPAKINDFTINLMNGNVFVEVVDRGWVVARGQVELDQDDDGLTDPEEAARGTSPTCRDTDGDGLLDGEEAYKLGMLDWTVNRVEPRNEHWLGSDPKKVDSDGDGLADVLEVGMTAEILTQRQQSYNKAAKWGSMSAPQQWATTGTAATRPGYVHREKNMLLVDADPDTQTDPMLVDTDHDGFWDGPDVWADAGTAGRTLNTGEDPDGDGKVTRAGKDGELETLDDETDPTNPTSHPEFSIILGVDSDKDGLPDELEDDIGTNPYDADTDDDGVSDGDEVLVYGTNPLMPDSDFDGLPDGLELGISRSKFPSNTSLARTYCALRRGYQLDAAGQLDLIEGVPTYTELSYTPVRTNPFEPDSNYNGKLDREEDWNGNGIVDPGETDPALGLAAEPIDPLELDWRAIMLNGAPYSCVQKGSPPVNDHYRLVFFYHGEDETEAPYWDVPIYLSKGSGAVFPNIYVEPAGAANVMEEENPKAVRAGLKFVRIQAIDPDMTSSFVVKTTDPVTGNEIAAYRIALDPAGFESWLEDREEPITDGLKEIVASVSIGATAKSTKLMTSALRSTPSPSMESSGGAPPPVDGAGIWDPTEGAYYCGQLAEWCGTDPFAGIRSGLDAVDALWALRTQNGRNAMIQGVYGLWNSLMQGEIKIGPAQIKDFAVGQAIGILKGLGKVPSIIIGITFTYVGKPLELWMNWIMYWRYQLELEAPEEFCILSYVLSLEMADFAAFNGSMKTLELDHGWQDKLGPPTHFNYSTISAEVPAADAENMGPGWAVIPEEATTDESIESTGALEIMSFKVRKSSAGPTGQKTVTGPNNSNSMVLGYTIAEKCVSAEHAAAVAMMHNLTLHGLDGKVLEEVNNIRSHSVQYSGNRGTDIVSSNQDGTQFYRTESKTGTHPQLGKGKRDGCDWVENDPRHGIISDISHFYYGNDKNGNHTSMEERMASIDASSMSEAEKNYYRAVHAYAQDIKKPDGVGAWLTEKAQSLDMSDKKAIENFIKKYGVDPKSGGYKPHELIHFRNPETSLFFEYLQEKHAGMENHVVHYWSHAKLLFAVESRVMRPEGMTHLIKNTDDFLHSKYFNGVNTELKNARGKLRLFSFTWNRN